MAYHSKIRAQVQANLARAGFPLARRNRVENILVQVICHFRLFRNRSRVDTPPIPVRTHLRVQPKRRGPKDKKEMRMYLLSQLHYAWVVGFQEYPNINNKNYPSTPFVAFAESVLLFEGIFRIAGNLEEFRAYRKKTLIASGFRLIRGKVI